MAKYRTGIVAGVVLAVIMLMSVLAPWISPSPPNQQDLGAGLLPPLSDGHLLGTDELGRDVLSRLISGGRPILLVAFVSTTAALLVGTLAGLAAGFLGKGVDMVVMRFADIQLSIPPIALAVLLAAVMGPGIKSALVSIPLVTWPQIARVVRSDVMRVSSADYVSLARVAGMGKAGIARTHVMPNVSTVVVVIGTLNLGVAVIYSAALSFLGLGVQAPRADWGNMLAGGTQYLDAWWLVVLPGALLTLVVLCVTLVGDALRDRLDPRHASSDRAAESRSGV